MLDLGWILLLTLGAAGVGLRAVRRLGVEPEEPADALAIAVPTGLGLLALSALGLAEAGMLTVECLAVVLTVGAAIGGRDGLLIASRLGRAAGGAMARPSFIDLVLAVGVLGTLLTALAPVTDGDALCYHLQVPKVFLAGHAAVFEPDLHETVYPLTTEMLYAVALAFRGPVACRLVQWVLGLAFAAIVTAVARPVLGHRARWAGAVALLAPAVSNGMGAPLNDVALAAFGNAALLAWLRWLDRPSPRAAALAGALAGMAVGVKYPGLVWAGTLGLAMALFPALRALGLTRDALGLTPSILGPNRKPLVPTLRVGMLPRTLRVPIPDDRKPLVPTLRVGMLPRTLRVPIPDDAERRARRSHAERGNEGRLAHQPIADGGLTDLAIFGVVALMVGGGWYLRAYVHTGNPVYPFFRHAFGGAGIDDVLDPIKRPMDVTPWNVLTALGPMTLQPDRFDSLSHQFGPAFLLFLPGLALLRPPRRVLGIVGLGLAFLTACVCVRQSMRFVLIALGPMAVGVAWAAASWKDRGTLPARALTGLLMLILGAEAVLALGRARHGIGVVTGRESAGAFLDRREPTYRVGRWIGENLPEGARLVGQEHRGYYLPRPYTMELAHRRRTGLGTRGEPAEGIVERLRGEGFTHLLLCPPEPESAVEFDPTLGRRLAPWLAGRAPLYREAITDPDGVTRRYAIYDLAAGPALARGTTR